MASQSNPPVKGKRLATQSNSPFKVKRLKTSEINPPCQLPRELIDRIIHLLICSYDNDPAYQWTHLRYVTRFHKKQLEQHFFAFWLPRLNISVYAYRDGYMLYRAKTIDKESWNGTARFEATEDRLRGAKTPLVLNLGKRIILRLGEGLLNGGREGGGIISDCNIPGLESDGPGMGIRFNWTELFDVLFKEEMIVRSATKEMTKAYMSSIRATKSNRRILTFLRTEVQFRRRIVLEKYRSHRRSNCETPFSIFGDNDLSCRLKLPDNVYWFGSGRPSIFHIVEKEESMIFEIPGWRNWEEAEIDRLRTYEKSWDWTGKEWYRPPIR